jgi:hypothetical protein
MMEHNRISDHVVSRGPPKSEDRRVLAALIGIVTAVVLALIVFVAFSHFPGTPEGSADKTTAPPEDVRR